MFLAISARDLSAKKPKSSRPPAIVVRRSLLIEQSLLYSSAPSDDGAGKLTGGLCRAGDVGADGRLMVVVVGVVCHPNTLGIARQTACRKWCRRNSSRVLVLEVLQCGWNRFCIRQLQRPESFRTAQKASLPLCLCLSPYTLPLAPNVSTRMETFAYR
ncbi:uncharacterized protein LY79DRAFT_370215 [Colletotrichum navitas]|uniref:Uncharacterized protein n=1 Tax=Colletotrichum navitas TaxID=681940 RepID=A0AAD8PQ31_9PEZI|nr:uncharacterized protein LY79DRAFT_370215 [Colletotrichum navitas]KAK1574222.1 hypothetical protein LY79DRAFT_370215 [Colletotrichum navitas]